MALAIFLGLCIVAIDFLIYALFQWTFGDKRRALQRQLAAHRGTPQQPPRPVLLPSHKAGPQTQARLQRIRQRLQTSSPAHSRAYHQRLA
ncbi:MAG TPA: hypothetical protein VEJ47_14410 [Candidatus Eremiobacteraceae bacterium]|nr:hypothetical protein [Candidatus Eremiobacteraceae bacterium]